jgi:hypothetical protein
MAFLIFKEKAFQTVHGEKRTNILLSGKDNKEADSK